MGKAASVARIAGVCLGIVAAASCGGEKIRLGDAAGGANAAGAGVGGSVSGGSFGGASGGSHKEDGGAAGASSGGEGGARCSPGDVKADEVLWIGDTWVTIPGGIQYQRVQELAREAGAIEAGEEYIVLAAPATYLDDIVNQYKVREAGPTKVKVLIMDGGTWDTLNAGGSDASVTKVVSTFRQFLGTVASDGTVQHIIYYLMPELPRIAGVAALRPELTRACSESTVPCHFIDLQTVWNPAYTDPSSGIQASEAGAAKIAELIWATMQEHCIAQ